MMQRPRYKPWSEARDGRAFRQLLRHTRVFEQLNHMSDVPSSSNASASERMPNVSRWFS